jgi:hypothetical protein
MVYDGCRRRCKTQQKQTMARQSSRRVPGDATGGDAMRMTNSTAVYSPSNHWSAPCFAPKHHKTAPLSLTTDSASFLGRPGELARARTPKACACVGSGRAARGFVRGSYPQQSEGARAARRVGLHHVGQERNDWGAIRVKMAQAFAFAPRVPSFDHNNRSRISHRPAGHNAPPDWQQSSSDTKDQR